MAISFVDAITLFETSPTGQGAPRAGQNNYGALATDVVRKLKELNRRRKIWFHELAAGLMGDSNEEHNFVRVNNRFSEKLAETSLILCHEGTHLARRWHLLDEELRCRYLQIAYYNDLLGGHSIRSRQTCYITDPDVIAEFGARERHLKKHQLIDHILATNNYTSEYAAALDAGWIRRRIGDWGGTDNRWPRTKGLYVCRLAADPLDDEARRIVRILNSIQSDDHWTAMTEQWGPVENIRRVLRRNHDSNVRRDVERLQSAHGNPLGQVY